MNLAQNAFRTNSLLARARSAAAFTLLEITLALGIASVGMVMLLGLLSSGQDLFRGAVDVNVSAQIAQRLVQEAVQTDYDTLTNNATSTDPINKGWRYFDNEGVEVPSGQASTAIYHVLTRIVPASPLPRSTGLATSESLATITVQVTPNPGNKIIAVRPISANDPLSATIDPVAGVSFTTYTSHIAKIK